MSDLRDRIRGDQSSFELILDWIPGFRGYREQELRRDADRLVREHLVGLLGGVHARLRQVAADHAKQAKLKHLGALDSVSKRLEKATDLLRFAEGGYSGWFAAVKINADDLDRLYDYDVSLKQFIADLDAAVGELSGTGDEQLGPALDKVSAALGELEHMIANREQVATQLVP